VRFWKYHGLGNDFVLFEDFDGQVPDDADFVRAVCDRRRGVGADGILYVRGDDEADAYMKIMNSDGSEAEMCGNGIRCVAKHMYDFGIAREETMTIMTLAGLKTVSVRAREGEVETVTVGMGAPKLDRADIPMIGDGRAVDAVIDVDGTPVQGTGVCMGNPHFVVLQALDPAQVDALGPKLERHPAFPRKTNVEFARPEGNVLNVRVYERGAAWTDACGTGACATAVAAGLKGVVPLGQDVIVRLPGGDLVINAERDLSNVHMTGPAVRSFTGDWEL